MLSVFSYVERNPNQDFPHIFTISPIVLTQEMFIQKEYKVLYIIPNIWKRKIHCYSMKEEEWDGQSWGLNNMDYHNCLMSKRVCYFFILLPWKPLTSVAKVYSNKISLQTKHDIGEHSIQWKHFELLYSGISPACRKAWKEIKKKRTSMQL